MSKKKYFETLHKNLLDHFGDLQNKYSISEEDRKTFLESILKTPPTRKKNKVDPIELCHARKQDGERCTRRKKQGDKFCGKHINNRRYGCFDDNNNIVDHNKIITLKPIKIQKENYYIDKDKILYDPTPKNGMYEVKGKLLDNQEIFWAIALPVC
jgi:hypothetical protein